MESDRDAPTVDEQTEYDVPDRPGCDLAALPAFEGEGWLGGDRLVLEDHRPPMVATVVEDADRDLRLQVGHHPEPNFPLSKLPDHNRQSIRSRGETGNSGHGETYVAGDFYVDYRIDNREWTGREWDGGTRQLRVRRRPDADARHTVVVDATDVVERPVDDKGRISVGTDRAGETVRVAVLGGGED